MEQKILNYDGNIQEGIDFLLKNIEQHHGSKIFTIRVGDQAEDKSLDVLIVFEDRAILEGKILVELRDGAPSMNIKGNYI